MSPIVVMQCHIQSQCLTHIIATVRSCFTALRQIYSIRSSLPRHARLTLIHVLVISKVDYCKTVLTGISSHLMDRLQFVLNAAARLVFSARRSDHATSLLHERPWLQVPEQIEFRLCVLTYRYLHGTAPPYLAESFDLTTDVITCCCLAGHRQPDASCATYSTIISWRSCFSCDYTQGMEQTF